MSDRAHHNKFQQKHVRFKSSIVFFKLRPHFSPDPYPLNFNQIKRKADFELYNDVTIGYHAM